MAAPCFDNLRRQRPQARNGELTGACHALTASLPRPARTVMFSPPNETRIAPAFPDDLLSDEGSPSQPARSDHLAGAYFREMPANRANVRTHLDREIFLRARPWRSFIFDRQEVLTVAGVPQASSCCAFRKAIKPRRGRRPFRRTISERPADNLEWPRHVRRPKCTIERREKKGWTTATRAPRPNRLFSHSVGPNPRRTAKWMCPAAW